MPQGFVDQDIPGSRIGDGGSGRIVDPVTGGGLFNPDMDYSTVGIDPLTGGSAPVGTDLGFSAPIRRFLQTGVLNGDFSFPPPDTSKPINSDTSGSNDDANYNPLPAWLFVPTASGAITCQWIADTGSGSGGAIRWTLAAGLAGDDAYLQMIIPIESTRAQTFTHWPSSQWSGATITSSAQFYISSQYLKTDAVTTTGTAHTQYVNFAPVPTSYAPVSQPDNSGVTPSDAAWLRVRIGVRRNTGALTDAGTVDLYEVWDEHGSTFLLITDYAAPATVRPGSFDQNTGVLEVAPGAGVGSDRAFRVIGAHLQLAELAAAPSTPASGYTAIYALSADSHLYAKNDAGTVVDLTAAAPTSGTWTPVPAYGVPGTSSWATSAATGIWRRIGDQIFVAFSLTTVPTNGSASADFHVSGLPVANGSGLYLMVPCSFDGYTHAAWTEVTAYINPAGTSLNFSGHGSGVAGSYLQVGDIPSGGTVNVNGSFWYPA